jgi:dimeric dUTPase (all-alpha-NTP-PPase superfamily)
MRVYKLLNCYIDLDHVLAITDILKFWEYGDGLVFLVTLAFNDKPMRLEMMFKDQEPERESNFRQAHIDFLNAWSKKGEVLDLGKTEVKGHTGLVITTTEYKERKK